MNYSFTLPNKKSLLKKISRIWWGYIFLTIFILLGFVSILKVQGYIMREETQASLVERENLLQEIKNYQTIQIQEGDKVKFGNVIASQNVILKESVENLFGMIPEQITLKKIEMNKTQLTLYGVTPSRQVYTFLLEVPLRSIFNQSRADFYALPNGWYNFVSVSKLNEEIEE
ncbi:hypothetical protein [Helicobacter mesocricetorum]|uniref:hypothetical protein n=1 Tax=Helicobacter mesocricetorum TaxID=87012 RepID=UPI000CF0E8B3|nr:hypothetical protein [Helicobacter mesocricetorum]